MPDATPHLIVDVTSVLHVKFVRLFSHVSLPRLVSHRTCGGEARRAGRGGQIVCRWDFTTGCKHGTKKYYEIIIAASSFRYSATLYGSHRLVQHVPCCENSVL
jgi:hypothetical protein